MPDPRLDRVLERIRAATLNEIRHTPQDDPRDDYSQAEIDRYGDEAADRYEDWLDRKATQ